MARAKGSQRAWRKRNPERYLLQLARRRAENNGLAFDLEVSDIPIPKRCPLLGIRLAMNIGQSGDNSPTLDRILPDLGYERGNVWVISQRANQIKSNASYEEILRVGENLRTLVEGGTWSLSSVPKKGPRTRPVTA